MARRVVLPIAAAFLMALTVPAWAGPGVGGGGFHGGPPLGTGHMGNSGGAVRGLGRADEVAGDHGDKGRDIAETRSNKGGKQRGGDRANDVAGPHGAGGRAHQPAK